jgi:hypothetical protein
VRFLLALARANAVPTAVGISGGLALANWFVGAHLLQLPFLQDAVEAGRIFPALLAGCGALVVATEWGEHENTGSRPVAGLLVGRWAAGAVVTGSSALLLSATLSVVSALYLLLGALATVLPRHWWLALPALLYLQLYVPPDLLPR